MKRPLALALFVLLVGAVVVSLLPREPRNEQEFVERVRQIVRSDNVKTLVALGQAPGVIDWYVWLRDKDRLPNWSVSVFPAPAGFGQAGERWLIFHKFQLVQELCDRVHPIRQTAKGFRLGVEVTESIEVPFEIELHDLQVRFEPSACKAIVRDRLTIRRTQASDRALLMRLNAPYQIRSASLEGKPIPVVNFNSDATQAPASGDWLGRAGGLLWLQAGRPLPERFELELEYEGIINFLPDDRVSERLAVLCSYWYPHIGRRPSKHQVTVYTPTHWLGFAQGNKLSEQVRQGERITVWRNDLPVCFFSVVAGEFRETANARSTVSGKPIRVFQIEPERARAQRIAQRTAQAMDFFERLLTPYPYREYILLEVPDFGDSGLEAYSFTFVDPAISEWAGSHELAHTWWGGIVPNTYTRSIWSESLTQYVDSVLFAKNADGTLELGYQTIYENTVPIGSAFVPLDPVMSMAGYMRGAYVMRMLENEIGYEAMVQAMRRFIAQRAGKAAEWEHFLQAVNQVTGKNYGWFFEQWIKGAEFPTVEILSAQVQGKKLVLRLRQSGTHKPFRLRLPLRVLGERAQSEYQTTLVMSQSEQQFQIDLPFVPKHLLLEPERGYSLVRTPAQGLKYSF